MEGKTKTDWTGLLMGAFALQGVALALNFAFPGGVFLLVALAGQVLMLVALVLHLRWRRREKARRRAEGITTTGSPS